MKWLFYWVMYTSNLHNDYASGVMLLSNDSATFYTHDHGYRTFQIVAGTKFHKDVKNLTHGNFLLKKDNSFVTIIIHPSFIEYTVIDDGHKEKIKVKRKYPK